MGMPWVCQAARLLGCLVIDAIIPTYIFPQTGLTCMGFVLLWTGRMPGPHDFASVSGLACLGISFSPSSPSALWALWAAWFYTCLPCPSMLCVCTLGRMISQTVYCWVSLSVEQADTLGTKQFLLPSTCFPLFCLMGADNFSFVPPTCISLVFCFCPCAVLRAVKKNLSITCPTFIPLLYAVFSAGYLLLFWVNAGICFLGPG